MGSRRPSNERGAKASAQAEEQHAAAAVAAECLHGSVVDDFDRTTERLLEVETDPPGPEVRRFVKRFSAHDGSGVSDGDDRVIPVASGFLHFFDHLLWRHPRAGRDLDRLEVAGSVDLDVRAADIKHQYFHIFPAIAAIAGFSAVMERVEPRTSAVPWGE